MINTETAGSEYPPLVALISATPLQTRSTHCHLKWGNCRALYKAAILFLHLRMRTGFSLEKFVFSLGQMMKERERDTFYFLSIPWEECLSPDQPEGPGLTYHVNAERNLGGWGVLLSSWTLEIDSLSASLVSQNPPLPAPSPKQHTQAPYLCL